MSKYHAIPTTVDGIRFDSKKEAARYSDLKLLARAGEIRDLVLQPKFKLEDCTYVADFEYVTKEGVRIVEDCKGVKTAMYRLKKKMVKRVYGIDILET